jgi:hypothetical protein
MNSIRIKERVAMAAHERAMIDLAKSKVAAIRALDLAPAMAEFKYGNDAICKHIVEALNSLESTTRWLSADTVRELSLLEYEGDRIV